MKGWIGVDLDGTLAYYDEWKGAAVIGWPIAAMYERVERWLEEGKDVRIFTARVSTDGTWSRDVDAAEARIAIADWCQSFFGRQLRVTCQKDYAMVELWDDRAVAVEANTGKALNRSRRNL